MTSSEPYKWRRNDFDRWRAWYPWLSHSEQVEFYNQMAVHWPDQHQYDAAPVIELCKRLDMGSDEGIHVVELGGYDGVLAGEVLAEVLGIATWTNFDICTQALVVSCELEHKDKRYEPFSLPQPVWEMRTDTVWASVYWPPDLFIASHVIEHLSLTHFCRLAEWLRGVPVVHFQAPLGNEGTDWSGYVGAHILPIGWRGVCEVMRENCFKLVDNGCEKTVSEYDKQLTSIGYWPAGGKQHDYRTFEYQAERPEIAHVKTAEDLTEADPCVESTQGVR